LRALWRQHDDPFLNSGPEGSCNVLPRALRVSSGREKPVSYVYFIQAGRGGPIKIGFTINWAVSCSAKNSNRARSRPCQEFWKKS
jgi:hypothetical protein